MTARADNRNAAARHERAVAQTLSWADEAAACGDYAGALAWLRTVEMVGDRLSSDYDAKRQRWRQVVRANLGQSGDGPP